MAYLKSMGFLLGDENGYYQKTKVTSIGEDVENWNPCALIELYNGATTMEGPQKIKSRNTI